LVNINCVFWFSQQHWSQTFVILRRFQHGTIMSVCRSSHKVLSWVYVGLHTKYYRECTSVFTQSATVSVRRSSHKVLPWVYVGLHTKYYHECTSVFTQSTIMSVRRSSHKVWPWVYVSLHTKYYHECTSVFTQSTTVSVRQSSHKVLPWVYVGLHTKYPVLLSDFSETWIFLTDFQELRTYHISRTSVQRSWIVCVDRQTDMMKLIIILCILVNMPDDITFPYGSGVETEQL
jgi:hypothetical protein